MKRIALLAAAIISLGAPAAFAKGPSSADSALIDKAIDAVIAALKQGDSDKAVDSFFGNSQVIKADDARLTGLKSQLANTFRLYGRVSSCSSVPVEDYSDVIVTRQFICVHQKYATRWKFTLVKLPFGWSAVNFTFDDQLGDGPF